MIRRCQPKMGSANPVAPNQGCIRTAVHCRRRGGGTPPPTPFQCWRLTAKILLRRVRPQEDLSLKIFGPPLAGNIGGPKEEGGPSQTPLPPPHPSDPPPPLLIHPCPQLTVMNLQYWFTLSSSRCGVAYRARPSEQLGPAPSAHLAGCCRSTSGPSSPWRRWCRLGTRRTRCRSRTPGATPGTRPRSRPRAPTTPGPRRTPSARVVGGGRRRRPRQCPRRCRPWPPVVRRCVLPPPPPLPRANPQPARALAQEPPARCGAAGAPLHMPFQHPRPRQRSAPLTSDQHPVPSVTR